MDNPRKAAAPAGRRSLSELREWVRNRLPLFPGDEDELLDAFGAFVAWQREEQEGSKQRAIHVLADGFRARMARLEQEVSSRDDTIKDISLYFEGVLNELMEQAQLEPKTRLLHFKSFMERLERFLAYERRLRWCAVGLVDITNFKWYNDAVGHLLGDRIIERVARVLAEQIRSDDLLAAKGDGAAGPAAQADLHARIGGDEFCFLVPHVPDFHHACALAQRFKTSIERHDWTSEHPALAEHPVMVDVGLVTLQLGPVAVPPSNAVRIAAELIQHADDQMYRAKERRSRSVEGLCLRIDGERLIPVEG